jgi:hypothetical protein
MTVDRSADWKVAWMAAWMAERKVDSLVDRTAVSRDNCWADSKAAWKDDY